MCGRGVSSVESSLDLKVGTSKHLTELYPCSLLSHSHMSGWLRVHHKHQTWIYLAVTETHFFLCFPPWIADHYSFPSLQQLFMFWQSVNIFTSVSSPCFLLPFDFSDFFWAFSVFSSGFCPDGLPCCCSYSSYDLTCAECVLLLSQLLQCQEGPAAVCLGCRTACPRGTLTSSEARTGCCA